MSSCKRYFLIFSLTCLVVQAQAQITGSKAETKTDVSEDTKLPLYRQMLNVSYSQDDTENILDASPYYRITKETGVPTILFHGGRIPWYLLVRPIKCIKNFYHRVFRHNMNIILMKNMVCVARPVLMYWLKHWPG